MADHPIDPRDYEPYGEPWQGPRCLTHSDPLRGETPCPKCAAEEKKYREEHPNDDPRDDRYPGEVHNRTLEEPKPTRVTLSGKPPEPNTEGTGAPGRISPASGQHTDYWVLSAEERAKGFVEPVRKSYRHVGISGPKPGALRDLNAEEKERYGKYDYVKFETYEKGHKSAAVGRFWTQTQLDSVGKGCGAVTSMSSTIAETYARQPEFYGSTFCVNCGTHLRVGEDGEFVWEGTRQRVGTRGKPPTPEEWRPVVDVVNVKTSCETPDLTGPPAVTVETGWKPYVPTPLEDVSELLAAYKDSKQKLSRATLVLEYEGTGVPPVTLVLRAEEGTALLMRLDMQNGISKEETLKGTSLSNTGESDFKFEIYKRKIP
jgi:hypothetical protein